jgi:5-methyltetrahydropteroyltriglutamate--homocysteine methyltransferase
MDIRFHTDHVGSLLRPAELISARNRFAKGEIELEQLRDVENAAIDAVISKQKAIGIDVVSDGEFRRAGWYEGFRAAVKGFVPHERSSLAVWKGPSGDMATKELREKASVVIGEKLQIQGRFTGVESSYLAAHGGDRFKITMPGCSTFLHFFEPGVTDKVYEDRDALLADIVSIYLREVDGLVAEGVPMIQIDSLRYGDAMDPKMRSIWESRGVDPMTIARQALDADNKVLARAEVPGVIRAMHICRGNHRSAWVGEGGYEPIADLLFNGLRVDRFLLEYDDDRSGGFEPLRFVPDNKVVVLGLVTTKSGELESQDELIRRIDEAAEYVPLQNLALGTQCGFASTELGNLLTIDDQWRKLELIVDTAQKVWG